jgi:predicted transcriptional regulator
MKTAVSIPDEIYGEAEALARQLNASRSEIYSRALSEFLGRHAPDRVTAQMNEALTRIGEQADPFTQQAARRILKRIDW